MSQHRYFEILSEGPVTVLKFTEKHLNETNVQEIGAALAGVAAQLGTGELHLDFSDVEYLSTVVMAKLLALHKQVTQVGGRFVLTNLADLYELFSVARLDELMEIHRQQPTGPRLTPEGPAQP